MSAWVVSRKHIDYLVSAAKQYDPHHYMRYGETRMAELTTTELGRDLWRENMASVAYRYEDARIEDEMLADYRFCRVAIDPVVALKAIDCYEYQSCEHPEWRASKARKFCDDLRGVCICALPGYDQAPWGID